jgi:transposase-like protein
MQADTQFCSNPDCPARGHIGEGNIIIHQTSTGRYRCTVCGKTFCARKGTLFYRKRKDEQEIERVVVLVGHGCPIPAITAAYGYDERTVRKWEAESGRHCRQVHEHLIEQPRAHRQIQADELRLKVHGGIVWVAMAICVVTRLWLGAEGDTTREQPLFDRLACRIRRCCCAEGLLLVTDGLKTYVKSLLRAFRDPIRTGNVGRPQLRVWPGLAIAQCVKGYLTRGGRSCCQGLKKCRVGYGTFAQVGAFLRQTQTAVTGVLNTAYIERFNATVRARLAGFARRTRALFRHPERVLEAIYLMGTLYNFCTPHQSLRLNGLRRTPAMASGITDHLWTARELLTYNVPPPRWTPPKKRGRRSHALQAVIDRWYIN